LKKNKINSSIKWSLTSFFFLTVSCSVNQGQEYKTTTNTIKLHSLHLEFNYHIKNGNYILSVNDSIGNSLTHLFLNSQDSTVFRNDTIDLELTDSYYTRTPIERVLRHCIEIKDVKIYSISELEYITKITRTVSKSNFKNIHNSYLYTNASKSDTILYSISFDTGTPPF